MKRLAAFVLTLLSAGCGAELDRSSEVETLRVMGMHKSKSYARPGDEITFTMLWHDAEAEDRDVRPQWFLLPSALGSALGGSGGSGGFGGNDGPIDCSADTLAPILSQAEAAPFCVNPPQDSYYGCIAGLGALFSETTAESMSESLGCDGTLDLLATSQRVDAWRTDSVTVRIPGSTTLLTDGPLAGAGIPDPRTCEERDDPEVCRAIIHPTQDLKQPDLGSVFMWYALCPGRLVYDETVSEGFGLLCVDEDDTPYGSDDYVLGYSQIFIYDDIENENPVVEGLEIAGEEVDVCVGPDCALDTEDPPTECGDGVACLDVCTAADEEDCGEVSIKPVVPCLPSADDPSDCTNAERDEIARLAYGRNQTEQMWIRYYTTQGRMDSEVRLLNDALTGWNHDYGTELRLPTEPGPVTIWAVVADSRGGQNWVRAYAVAR